MLKTIADVKLLELSLHSRVDGSLIPLELGKDLPFAVSRIFFVLAAGGAVRGQHSHKQCNQFLLCPSGVIDVECDDGDNKKHYRLDKPNQALLIPSGIWASETYRGESSVLTVLCDQLYEEGDYLRDYTEFCAWRKESGK